MWIASQNATVHIGTRITLVGIAHDVLAIATVLAPGHLPLLGRGEPRAAAAPEPRTSDLLDDLLGGVLGQHLGERLVAIFGDIAEQPDGVEPLVSSQQGALLLGEEGYLLERAAGLAGRRISIEEMLGVPV